MMKYTKNGLKYYIKDSQDVSSDTQICAIYHLLNEGKNTIAGDCVGCSCRLPYIMDASWCGYRDGMV